MKNNERKITRLQSRTGVDMIITHVCDCSPTLTTLDSGVTEKTYQLTAKHSF